MNEDTRRILALNLLTMNGANCTVVIPHRDMPEWLDLSVQFWQNVDNKPFIYVIDTQSKKTEALKLLDNLSSLPMVEVACLNMRDTPHPSDPIAIAMDLAFSRCETTYLLATHIDMFPKRRDIITYLMSLCDQDTPVVGWEMSPRGYGADGNLNGKLSDGCPGHVCTLFHMPTMDQVGAGWSLRRSHNAFGTRRTRDKRVRGWPDTETCMGQILSRSNKKCLWLGREINDENQETDWWIHVRSATRANLSGKPSLRHIDGLEKGRRLFDQWQKDIKSSEMKSKV